MGGILTVQRSVEQPDEASGLCDRCFFATNPVGTAWPGASPETIPWLWSASTESAAVAGHPPVHHRPSGRGVKVRPLDGTEGWTQFLAL